MAGNRPLPTALPVGAALLGCLLLGTACSGAPDTSPRRAAATGPTASASTATGTTSPSASPSTGSAAGPAGSKGFTLVATGDMLLHEPLWEQARRDARRSGSAAGSSRDRMDYGPLLSAVTPLIAGADLALCHLETPFAPAAGPYDAYPSFAAPPQLLPAMTDAGYDACSTASNHTFDKGAAGVDRTLDALDDAGIAHAGSARSRTESLRTTTVRAGGAKVALLSYTYGFNGIPYPGGDRWRSNVIDAGRIADAAATARRRGAEVVVLSLHWGAEYQHEPDAQQRELAPRLARNRDIDVIIGHHAHVVQPIERIGRTWVVYGLGNLVAWHSTPVRANAEGLLVRFTFTPRPARNAGGGEDSRRFDVTRAEYEPLLVARDAPVRLLDVPVALRTKSYGSSSRARLREALDRTTRVVLSRGGRADGLTRIG